MILQVLTIPKNEEFLRQKSKNFDLSLLADQFWQNFLKDLQETMASANGIGLAAPQAGQAVRIITVDFEGETKIMINPKITKKSWRHEIAEEGCLSVPGIYENVTRAERVTVKALDAEGKSFTLKAEGLLAICIQHEIDHLKGKVFVEYLSRLKLNRIRQKMIKLMRETL